MSHMTQTANPVTLLASPLGEEGHEVAKGCTRVRMIMILDVDVTAERRHYNTHRPQGRYHNPRPERPSNLRTLRPSGRSILRTFPLNPHTEGVSKGKKQNDTGRRLAVRTAMGCQIGALPRTPFASSRRSPQGETRSMERKNRESYISCTIPQFPPLVVNAVSQSPACLSCHMTQKANPVTLTLYLSPPKGETTHYILRVASAPSKCVRCAPRGRYHNPRPERPSNLRTLRTFGPEARQPPSCT